MIVYHGSNVIVDNPDIEHSFRSLDFGKGFYVTDNKEKAIERAFKKTNDYNKRYHCKEEPYLVEVFIDDDLWKEMKTRFFKRREQDWFTFVINNRLELSYLKEHNICNHNKDNKYDIVFGEIADGKIANIANDIKTHVINYTDLNFMDFLPENKSYYGSQYSFHTRKSLSCIKNISCAIIKSRKMGRR